MNLDEALNPDLIGALPDGKMTLPKPAFELVHAAAREFNQTADSVNSGEVNSNGVELDRLREALDRFEVAVPDWHEGQQGIFVAPASLDDGLAVHAAARRFLALTETGRQVRYCIEHQALIGALPYLCNVANWVIDGGGSPTDCRVVPRLLADYLTEEDR